MAIRGREDGGGGGMLKVTDVAAVLVKGEMTRKWGRFRESWEAKLEQESNEDNPCREGCEKIGGCG